GGAPKLIARPVHCGTERVLADFIGNDRCHLVQSLFEVLGVARATVRTQKFHTSASVEDPECCHAGVVFAIVHLDSGPRSKWATDSAKLNPGWLTNRWHRVRLPVAALSIF